MSAIKPNEFGTPPEKGEGIPMSSYGPLRTKRGLKTALAEALERGVTDPIELETIARGDRMMATLDGHHWV